MATTGRGWPKATPLPSRSSLLLTRIWCGAQALSPPRPSLCRPYRAGLGSFGAGHLGLRAPRSAPGCHLPGLRPLAVVPLLRAEGPPGESLGRSEPSERRPRSGRGGRRLALKGRHGHRAVFLAPFQGAPGPDNCILGPLSATRRAAAGCSEASRVAGALPPKGNALRKFALRPQVIVPEGHLAIAQGFSAP